jgi:uncharacterized protein YkwD
MPKPTQSLQALLPTLGLGPIFMVALFATAHASDAAPGRPAEQKAASLKSVSAVSTTSPNIPGYTFDADAEQQLLDLANQARSTAGAPPLRLDAGLSKAARAHAEAMAAAGQISHQFDGEPTLIVRLASSTSLHLERAGENVALDADPKDANEHLMRSPPHRENLLNPTYDVVGLGVVSVGYQLFIVQDFGHALPNLSVSEMKGRVAVAVAEVRQRGSQAVLPRHDLADADAAACSMANVDALATPAIQKLAARYSLMTYTTQHPEQLPAGANGTLLARELRSFSVGSCYARTAKYPAGAYWVVVSVQ